MDNEQESRAEERQKQEPTMRGSSALVRAGSDGLAVPDALPETLTFDEQLAFQGELWKLLEKRTALYTMGESSSVPELTAHRLLASALFVLDVDPDDLDAQPIRQMLEGGLGKTFNRNLSTIELEAKRTSKLWEAAAVSTPLLESIALKDTLESLRTFPAQYDYRSFAHEIPSDIDYPLAHPVSESLQGVTYVNEYLTRLGIENHVMQRFELAHCKALLHAVSSEYRSLIINLYEPIAVNAIGCILAGGSARDLTVTEVMRQRIVASCHSMSCRELERMLDAAAASACIELHIEDKQIRAYLRETALDIRPRLARFAKGDSAKSEMSVSSGLAGVFLSF